MIIRPLIPLHTHTLLKKLDSFSKIGFLFLVLAPGRAKQITGQVLSLQLSSWAGCAAAAGAKNWELASNSKKILLLPRRSWVRVISSIYMTRDVTAFFSKPYSAGKRLRHEAHAPWLGLRRIPGSLKSSSAKLVWWCIVWLLAIWVSGSRGPRAYRTCQTS